MLKKLELKIPPLIVTFILLAIIWGISNLFPALNFSHYSLDFLSFVLFLCGVVIALVAVFKFKQEDTTVDPTDPSKSEKLVVTGIYKYTRNPMYLSFFLFLLGFSIFFGNVLNITTLILFVCYMNRFQIEPEEEILLSKFGDEFKDYMDAVRRWL